MPVFESLPELLAASLREYLESLKCEGECAWLSANYFKYQISLCLAAALLCL